MIPGFDELFDSLPEIYHREEIKNKLLPIYNREVENIQQAMERATTPNVNFSLFYDTGSYQIIADCYVNDLSAPRGNSYNWHLVNTSQCVYAFGIVFDKQRLEFSAHH